MFLRIDDVWGIYRASATALNLLPLVFELGQAVLYVSVGFYIPSILARCASTVENEPKSL